MIMMLLNFETSNSECQTFSWWRYEELWSQCRLDILIQDCGLYKTKSLDFSLLYLPCWEHASSSALMRQRVNDAKARNNDTWQNNTRCRVTRKKYFWISDIFSSSPLFWWYLTPPIDPEWAPFGSEFIRLSHSGSVRFRQQKQRKVFVCF